MGRELRRKQAKKEGKSLVKEEIIEKNPLRKFIIITCILLIIMAIIYLATSLFITKELDWFSKKDKTEETKEETVSDSILASAIFKQKEAEYYVYFYEFDEEKTTVTDFINQRLSSEKVYKVNTKSAMNLKYVSNESNKNAKTLEDLKVKAPTVIKIKDGKIEKYYEANEIVNNL